MSHWLKLLPNAKDIFDYNKSSNGAQDYLALCEEILERTAEYAVQ